VLDSGFEQGKAALVVDPGQILPVLRWLRDSPGQGYGFLSSLHAVDYLPATPRFAVHYELLNRDRVERIRVKALLADPAGEELPEIDSCVDLFPTANFQERETYDFFGIVFRGHPDLTRILLPEDYVGWPLRRDFPIGGEPVTFTYNERSYG
jgi:NADH-quinone oxidoreductase subunit C